MNRRRRSSNNKVVIKKDKVIRCRFKMIPVFENDTCEGFVKKEQTEANTICKTCKHSF